MLTRDQVIDAYRNYLLREPESEESINYHLEHAGDLETLRGNLVRSPEFVTLLRSRYGVSTESWLPGHHPALDIETELREADRKAFFAHIGNTWKMFGETRPYWSVATQPDYLQENFHKHEERFYTEAQGEMGNLQAALARNGIDAKKLSSCLEYGCGTGRVTRWLAGLFDTVHALDISAPHLELAREQLGKRGIQNVQYHHLADAGNLDRLPRCDMVFTVIVLQHNPPPLIRLILDRLFASLNAGGVAYFQVPTYCVGYRFRVAEYLAGDYKRSEMEMHVLPQAEVFALAAKNDCQVLEVNQDGMTQALDRFRSNTFLVAKRR